MRKLYAFLSACLLGTGAAAQTTVPASTLSSAHWTLAGSPYKIMGHIIVANNDSLVIDPGVRVEFQGKYKLFCNGKIIAKGTPAQRITFTVPTANQSIGWLGIRYDNTPTTNGRSYFDYCTLEYGKADVTGDNQGGAFLFNNFSNCEITNSILRNNFATYGGAILGMNASPTITRDSFYNNSSYNGGLCVHFQGSSSIIDSCLFRDAGVYCLYSSVTVKNSSFIKCTYEGGVSAFSNASTGYMTITRNLFDSCTQYNGGGGGAILLSNALGRIEHNIFRNNVSPSAGGAISVWTQSAYPNSSSVLISNNLFYNNTAHINMLAGAPFGGGAIAFANCSGKVINNTIVGNHSDTAGGAIYCSYNSSPGFYNNIIFDNLSEAGGENIFVLDNTSDPNFYNNDLQGGWSAINTNGTPLVGANVGTINVAPGFTSAATGNYTLATGSPCIDAGTSSGISSYIPALDLGFSTRVTGAAIDMGAYEIAGAVPTGVVSPTANAALACYPNPVSSNFTIKGLQSGEIVSVQVLDMLGQQVARFDNTTASRFDISSIPSGMYVVRVHSKYLVQDMRILKN